MLECCIFGDRIGWVLMMEDASIDERLFLLVFLFGEEGGVHLIFFMAGSAVFLYGVGAYLFGVGVVPSVDLASLKVAFDARVL